MVASTEPVAKRRNIFYRIDWKPDIDFLSHEQAEYYCAQQRLADNDSSHQISSVISLGGLASFIDILAHKNPSMQILEVGAGTGSSSNALLSILNKQGKSEGNAPRYAKYVFTDHSPRFFEQARTRFASNAERTAFQMLNLRYSPIDQGFQAGSFDLVVAVDFFRGHDDSPGNALKNARTLLKPGGYLLLLETIEQEDTIVSGIWSGLLNWWSPKTAKTASWSRYEWESNLKDSGYSGLEASVPEGLEDDRTCLLSKQTEIEAVRVLPETITILVETAAQQKLADVISTYFKSNGLPKAIITTIAAMINQEVDIKADACFSLLDYGGSFLSNIDNEKLPVLKQIVTSAQRLYWITSGAGESPNIPENALNNGLSRAMVAETPGLLACTIDFRDTDPQMISTNLTQIIKKSYAVSSVADWEYDYNVFKGLIQIPRATEANDINSYVFSQTGGFTSGSTTVNGGQTKVEIPACKVSSQYSFNENASYVIAGGLGGAGRSLARYLSTRGAKHLILLSRSGAASDDAKKLVEELTSRGVNVATPRCDISKKEVVQQVIAECARTMPPVKGAIQGTMVLAASPLQKMDLEQWQKVLNPKIAGTWNLHEVLPKDMDFYVILSTLGGQTGTQNQCTYSASATFQDAFARHLWTQGQKCVSVDIGILNSVGYVAEHPEHAARINNMGHNLLEEVEFQSVVDWACNPALKIESPWDTQVLTGLDRPGAMLKRGKKPLPYMSMPLFRHLGQDEREIV